MVAIIKRIDTPAQSAVRHFAARSARTSPTSVTDPAAIERARLLEEIARLEEAVAGGRREMDASMTKAFEDGRRKGLAEAEDRAADRLAALASSLDAISSELAARLDGLDKLAAALAKTALTKVFYDPETTAPMVLAALARRVAALREGVKITVAVSAADFADADTLQAMLKSRRHGGATIERRSDLPSGACRLAAGLDTITLDLPEQWHALAASLDAMVAA